MILPFNIETEDLILAQVPTFIKLREQAREEYRRGLAKDWSELKARSANRKRRA